MKIVIDTAAGTLTETRDGTETSVGLFTKAAFETLSREWVRVGWSLKYYHNFSWFGLPILQLPEDLLRLAEVIYQVRPSVIVETGVFRGGSLLFHATLCEALGHGRVIGVDREIAAADRETINRHALGRRITLVEGDSTDPAIVGQVARLIGDSKPVLVILDSCHTAEHVARELECYSRFVSPGSYIIATDGIMRELTDVPGGVQSWNSDNPFVAATEFAVGHPEFSRQQPPWLFHDGPLTENVTYWPGAWLKRID
jgi:cephalosporin hydroxylase